MAYGYYSDIEIFNSKKPVRRAASVPINQKESKNSGSKVIKRVIPKSKDSFCSRKIIK